MSLAARIVGHIPIECSFHKLGLFLELRWILLNTLLFLTSSECAQKQVKPSSSQRTECCNEWGIGLFFHHRSFSRIRQIAHFHEAHHWGANYGNYSFEVLPQKLRTSTLLHSFSILHCDSSPTLCCMCSSATIVLPSVPFRTLVRLHFGRPGCLGLLTI